MTTIGKCGSLAEQMINEFSLYPFKGAWFRQVLGSIKRLQISRTGFFSFLSCRIGSKRPNASKEDRSKAIIPLGIILVSEPIVAFRND